MKLKQILGDLLFASVTARQMKGKVLGLSKEPMVGINVTVNDIV